MFPFFFHFHPNCFSSTVGSSSGFGGSSLVDFNGERERERDCICSDLERERDLEGERERDAICERLRLKGVFSPVLEESLSLV